MGEQTMNAVRYYGQKDLRLDRIPIPRIKPGFVKVAPKFCGICGTDLHEYMGGNNLIPTTAHPHPLTGESAPLTIGHEFSAIVEEVGEGVTHVKKGDKVCIQPTLWDGDCRACKRGMVNCCDNNGFVGLSGFGGGMSEFAVVPGTAIKKLPDNIPLEVGALIEPLSVGWHAVSSSPFRPDDNVLVIGGGPIGLAVIQALRAKGCSNIIVTEPSSKRRQFAKEFGAHHVINPIETDLVEEVNRLTNGELADIAFDAAGVQAGVDSALKAIRARGMLVNIAVWEKRATLNMNDMVFRERSYMGIATFALGDFEAVIEAISEGKL